MALKPGDRVGPFRLLRLLGEGGMASVFLAERLDGGPQVALKSVRVPSEALLPRIRREVAALARVRHPGIVRVLDSGLHEGLPWYAMEQIQGVTLRSHLRERRSRREHGAAPSTHSLGRAPQGPGVTTTALEQESDQAGPAPEAAGPSADRAGKIEPERLRADLGLVQRICWPLAYLHGLGLVHRDLKPENIMLREGEEPVLVDFGLVTEFGGGVSREALESSGAAGTVSYMAPEQARGELVDARADLYSLGCILYELTTGRRPFLGKSHYEVLRQHMEAAPAPPSDLVEGLPAELDELILRLLAKEPRHRIGYASDVAARLTRMGAAGAAWPGAEAPRSYLYRAGFAGRQEPLAWLEERIGRLGRGQGGMAWIAGESGVGKTRLALELSQRVAERGMRVLTGECFGPAAAGAEAHGGVPLEALRKPLQAIADRCREWGRREAERLVGRHVRVLETFEPAFSGLPGLESCPPPAELPPEAARMRLFGALAETFGTLAQDEPLVLVLDDLHWADELTLGFMKFLAQSEALTQTPLLVVGTYRSEEESEALRELAGVQHVETLRLGRLEEAAVGSMVADMLALSAPPQLFVRFLTRHSEGNPFFVAEYLRTAVAEEVLYRDAAGYWEVRAEDETATEATYEGLPLPRTLRDLVRRRLDGLQRPALRVVEAAAVLGREVEAIVLLQVAGLKEAEFLDATGALMRRQVLEDLGGEHFRFVHDKIREVAYEGIAKTRRRKLHRAAAEAIEEWKGTSRYEHLAAVGDHWDRAGKPVLAARYRVEAGERAAANYAAREGLEELNLAIPVLERRGKAIEFRSMLCRALYARNRVFDQLSRFSEAEIDARRLIEHAGGLTDELSLARGLRRLADAQYNQGRYDEALSSARASLAALERVQDVEELCRTRQLIGWIHASRGEYEVADAFFVAGLDIPGLAEDNPARLYCMMQRGLTFQQKGQYSLALRVFQDVLSRYERQGDPFNRALCQAAMGLAFRELGDRVRALALLEEARDTLGRLHAVQYWLLHGYNIGLILADQAEFSRASGIFEETRQAALRHGELSLAAGATLALSSCELPRCNVVRARELASSAVETFRRLGDRAWLSTSLLWEALGRWAAGQPTAAREGFQEALQISQSLGTPLHTWRLCFYWTHAHLEHTGTSAESRALALEALRLASSTENSTYIPLSKILVDLHEEPCSGVWSKLAELRAGNVAPQAFQKSVIAAAEVALKQGDFKRSAAQLRLYREVANGENLVLEQRAARLDKELTSRVRGRADP
jgi:serine/threonine protein kinase/tetratricopeptide (TPR) repeat protein